MAQKQEETAAQLAETTLTDEVLSQWEERVGLELRVGNVFNQNASYEAIRNFSNGMEHIIRHIRLSQTDESISIFVGKPTE